MCFEEAREKPYEVEDSILYIHSKVPLYVGQTTWDDAQMYTVTSHCEATMTKLPKRKQKKGNQGLRLERKTLRSWKKKLRTHLYLGGFKFTRCNRHFGLIFLPETGEEY